MCTQTVPIYSKSKLSIIFIVNTEVKSRSKLHLLYLCLCHLILSSNFICTDLVSLPRLKCAPMPLVKVSLQYIYDISFKHNKTETRLPFLLTQSQDKWWLHLKLERTPFKPIRDGRIFFLSFETLSKITTSPKKEPPLLL